MQKRFSRSTLGFAIVTSILSVIAVVLLFLIPAIDNNLFESQGYDFFEVLLGGLTGLFSFSFSDIFEVLYFVVAFAAFVIFVTSIIFWLIALLCKVKTSAREFVSFSFAFVFGSVGILMLACLLVSPASVVVSGGEEFRIHIIDDVLGFSVGVITLGGFTHILGIVFTVVTLLCFTGIFITPILGVKAVFYDRRVFEDAHARKQEKLAKVRQEREEKLISYVEYEAGKEDREKEYEAICAANGLAVEKREEPVAEPVPEKSFSEEYARVIEFLHSDKPVNVGVEPEVEEVPAEPLSDEYDRVIDFLNSKESAEVKEPVVEEEFNEEEYQRVYDYLHAEREKAELAKEAEEHVEVSEEDYSRVHEYLENEKSKFEAVKEEVIDAIEEELEPIDYEKEYASIIESLKESKIEAKVKPLVSTDSSEKPLILYGDIGEYLEREKEYYDSLIKELKCLRHQKAPVGSKIGK